MDEIFIPPDGAMQFVVTKTLTPSPDIAIPLWIELTNMSPPDRLMPDCVCKEFFIVLHAPGKYKDRAYRTRVCMCMGRIIE